VTTLPVFVVEQLPGGPDAVLDGPEGRHAAIVRRLGPGEQLVLSDGRGGLARCAVEATERDTVRLSVQRRWTEPEPRPRVILAQALVKGDRGELAVEQATEAGIDQVVPWRARRCVARWDDGERGAKARARWSGAVLQAAKQSRRAWFPEVTEPVSTERLAELAANATAALVLHESADRGIAELALPTTGDVLIVVGPEGGIDDDELIMLGAAGATAVRLGPTVLRASTAAAVALGAIGALTGRWRQPGDSAGRRGAG
jgi:16S rRNA (uracil1498-N3)-methyltransferase